MKSNKIANRDKGFEETLEKMKLEEKTWVK